MSEKVISDKPRVYHWSDGDRTLCGKTSLLMSRVALGQRGDGLPPCLKCAERKASQTKEKE